MAIEKNEEQKTIYFLHCRSAIVQILILVETTLLSLWAMRLYKQTAIDDDERC